MEFAQFILSTRFFVKTILDFAILICAFWVNHFITASFLNFQFIIKEKLSGFVVNWLFQIELFNQLTAMVQPIQER